jgi:hypothetical protein
MAGPESERAADAWQKRKVSHDELHRYMNKTKENSNVRRVAPEVKGC